jgi:hypothetical protein
MDTKDTKVTNVKTFKKPNEASRLVDRTNELYSDHAILRDGSA